MQLHNTDNVCNDLYILLKLRSELGYLGFFEDYLQVLQKSDFMK